MSPIEIIVIAALVVSTVYLLLRELKRGRSEASITPAPSRILFPFAGQALSTPAFDAALRLARAEGATLVPAYLAIVPLSVNLDTPLKKQAEAALPLLEAIEQRAASQGVPVDSRIEPGRTVRHALRLLMEHERFDRIVAAGATNGDGFTRRRRRLDARARSRRDPRPAAEQEDRRIHPAARETRVGITRSAGSSSGCQSTPRTKPSSTDSIASTLSSSVAHAVADSESAIRVDPLVMVALHGELIGAGRARRQ